MLLQRRLIYFAEIQYTMNKQTNTFLVIAFRVATLLSPISILVSLAA